MNVSLTKLRGLTRNSSIRMRFQIDDNSCPCIFLCIHNSNVVLPPTKENIMHVGYSAGISYFKS